jgi:GNAT superfamily N-acetyltransferase
MSGPFKVGGGPFRWRTTNGEGRNRPTAFRRTTAPQPILQRPPAERPPMPTPQLRPARDTDADFLYDTVEAHFRPQVEALGRKWSVARTQEKCRQDAAGDATAIVEVDGARAGFLCVHRRPDELWLDALVLLPAFRRQGIGDSLVAGLKREADARRVRTRLGVLKGNPVLPFWERHGFQVVGELDAMHVLMERAEQGPAGIP